MLVIAEIILRISYLLSRVEHEFSTLNRFLTSASESPGKKCRRPHDYQSYCPNTHKPQPQSRGETCTVENWSLLKAKAVRCVQTEIPHKQYILIPEKIVSFEQNAYWRRLLTQWQWEIGWSIFRFLVRRWSINYSQLVFFFFCVSVLYIISSLLR